MYWQRQLEQTAFRAGGSNYCAPAQLVGDFLALGSQRGAGGHAGRAQIAVGAGLGALGLKAQGALHAGVLGLARLVQLAVDRALRLLTDGGAGSLALGADGLEESLGAGI